MNKYTEFKQRHSLRATMDADGVRWKGKKAYCPFHPDETPSLSIKIGDDGFEYFKCFGCGAGGDVITYLELATGKKAREIVGGKVENLPRIQVDLDRPPPEPEPKQAFIYADAWEQFAIWNEALRQHDDLRAWLFERGVDWPACVMNWLGYAEWVEGLGLRRKMPMLVMPNFDPVPGPDGGLRFCSVEVRHLKHEPGGGYPPKYQTTGTRHLWHLPQLYRDAGRMVMLVESCRDAIAINRWCMRHIATACPASGFTEYHARQLSTFQRVFVLVDNDAAGAGMGARVKEMIKAAEVISLGAHDFGDLCLSDIKEAGYVIRNLVTPFYDMIDNAPIRELAS